MKRCFFVLVICFLSFSSIKAQEIELKKSYEYELPDGYDCTLLDATNGKVAITCPDAHSFFYLDNTEEDRQLKEVTYTIGRGPAEISRAPFGIGIIQDKIVLSDSELRRLFVYNMGTNEISIIKLGIRNTILGLYTTNKKNTVFLKTWAGLKGKEIGFFYNINTAEKSKMYNTTEEISVFEASGEIEITDEKILFASLQGGFISQWGINEEGNKNQLWEIFDSEIKLERATMNGRPALIPSDSEYEILDIEFNPLNANQFFLLISPVNEGDAFKGNYMYVFDQAEKKIVHKIELESEADLMEVDSGFLYLHFEDEDKLVKYEIGKG